MKELKYYFYANLLRMLAGFLVLPILLSRLSTDEFGLYVLYFSLGGFVSVFLGLNLSQAFTAYYQQWVDEKRYFSRFNHIFVLLCCFSLSICLFLYATNEFLFYFGYGLSPFLAFSVLLLAFFTLFSDFTLLSIRMEGKAKHFLGLAIVATMLDVLSKLIYVSVASEVVISRLLAISCISMSVFFLYSLVVFVCRLKEDKLSKKLGREAFEESIEYTKPLLLSALIARFTSFADKLIVGLVLGEHELGVYALASRIYGVVASFRTNIKTVWVPYAIKNYSNYALLNRSSDYFIMISLFLGVCAYIASFPFVAFFVSDEAFSSSISLVGFFVCVNLVSTSYLISAVVIPVSKVSTPIPKIQLTCSLMSLITLVVFCFFFSSVGAIYSIILNNIAQTFLVRRAYSGYDLTLVYWKTILFSLFVCAMLYYFSGMTVGYFLVFLLDSREALSF